MWALRKRCLTQAESNASVIRLVLCAEQSEPSTGAALRHRLFTYHISHLNIQIWIPNYYRCSIFHLVSEPLHSEVRTVTWKVSVALSSLPQRFGSSSSSGFLDSLDPSVKHELVPTRNDELNDTTREALFFNQNSRGLGCEINGRSEVDETLRRPPTCSV